MQDRPTILHPSKIGRTSRGGLSRLLFAVALGAVTIGATLPAHADDRNNDRYRQEREWDHHGWHRQPPPRPRGYYGPGYVYAPPPVVYAPPPPPPGINFVFPLHIH